MGTFLLVVRANLQLSRIYLGIFRQHDRHHPKRQNNNKRGDQAEIQIKSVPPRYGAQLSSADTTIATISNSLLYVTPDHRLPPTAMICGAYVLRPQVGTSEFACL